MKLVIDIHKKDYQSILNSGQVPYGVVCAIMNGTHLPKGHGRIVDIDKVLEEMRITKTYDIPFALERMKPIIEADKEG